MKKTEKVDLYVSIRVEEKKAVYRSEISAENIEQRAFMLLGYY